MRFLFTTATALCGLCAAGFNALAGPNVPYFRGGRNATHQEWNNFAHGEGHLSTTVLAIRALGTDPNFASATFNGLAVDRVELFFAQPAEWLWYFPEELEIPVE